MNREEKSFLKKCIKRLPRGGSVVEIGSWTGGSAYVMLSTAKKTGNPIKLFCIDPWNYTPGSADDTLTSMAEGRDIKDEFDKRLTIFKGKYKAIQHDSVNASKRFQPESLDMVFIDGDHSYDAVKADIEAWFPKIKVGGTICGHDYGYERYGVTQAVDEAFSKEDIENKARSMWKYIKKEVV